MPQIPPRQLPDGVSQRIHDIITGEGFTYRVDYRHDLSAIREEDTARVQIRFETEVDKQHVRKLAVVIKEGAKLDLICITEDEYRVFGTHRFESYKSLGQAIIPVIVIDVNAGEADPEVLRRLRIVGFLENSAHGKANSKATNEMATVVMREDGWPNQRISRVLGVPSNRVAEIVAVDKGTKALAEQGVAASFTKAVVGAIGRASEVMNRDPFAELVKLTADANLSKTEINNLVKLTGEAGSDHDAVAVINAERASLRPRVTGVDNGGHPSFAAQLRQKLGFINGKEANPQVLVEGSSAHAAEHLAMVQKSIEILTTVRDLMTAAQVEEDAA